MRAAVMRDLKLVVDDVPEPVPGPGQLLVRTIACGICGSDLHFLRYAEQMVALNEEMGMPGRIDLSRDLIMGHEFSAEVLEVGPDSMGSAKTGDIVVSIPVMVTGPNPMEDMESIAYSNRFNGGYAEYMLLSSMLALQVPNGLDPKKAALTEPMAVGLHAVNKSGIKRGEAAVVLGAGPVGLACIAALRVLGAEAIVAADFSPTRRALAVTMGATEAVDPREEPAVEAWQRVDGQKPLVIFEAVGVPGMLDQAMRAAPRNARILVVGVCMEQDTVRPMLGIGKELNIQFALGYDPFEFATTLTNIAEGVVDVDPLITGHVGIEGVPQAFEDLANPDAHAKILVEPDLT
jgi:threonine dehydrogenase-like Zn-dependent dehydrogenase